MERRHRFSIAAVAASLVGISVLAYGALSPASDAHVTFHAAGPAGMKIDGTTTELAVTDGASVVVTVTLTNLTTGIKLRDDHMKDKYLEVGKYKTAELKIDKAALNLKTGAGKQQASAMLTLHGSEPKPVTIQYTVADEKKDDKPGFRVTGNFRIDDMTKFGITIPNYLGVKVQEKVDVEANFHLEAL
jgi:polyisoprenoid-binding protein YceI